MNPLERIIYIITRAAVTAYLDVLEERAKAIEETPNAADYDRARRFADAIRLRKDGAVGS